jgi:hypothetical protein
MIAKRSREGLSDSSVDFGEEISDEGEGETP